MDADKTAPAVERALLRLKAAVADYTKAYGDWDVGSDRWERLREAEHDLDAAREAATVAQSLSVLEKEEEDGASR